MANHNNGNHFNANLIFAKIGPLWEAKFFDILVWNEFKVFKFVANHFNPLTGTSYPTSDQWDYELRLDRSARSLAQRGCASLGLLEKWYGPYKLHQQIHYGTFWRMPYIRLRFDVQNLPPAQQKEEKKSFGLHFDELQQPLAHSLLTIRREQGRNGLPWQYQWVADSKTHLSTPEVSEDDIKEEIERRMRKRELK